jgi:cell division septation protein DedD
MNHARDIAAIIAVFSLTLSSPAAWAADPVEQPRATTPPASDDVEPTTPAEVLKTKTRSNQSNDRQASPPSPKEEATPAEEPDAVLKSKTKSNQSND